jgi:hypothetical protein
VLPFLSWVVVRCVEYTWDLLPRYLGFTSMSVGVVLFRRFDSFVSPSSSFSSRLKCAWEAGFLRLRSWTLIVPRETVKSGNCGSGGRIATTFWRRRPAVTFVDFVDPPDVLVVRWGRCNLAGWFTAGLYHVVCLVFICIVSRLFSLTCCGSLLRFPRLFIVTMPGFCLFVGIVGW